MAEPRPRATTAEGRGALSTPFAISRIGFIGQASVPEPSSLLLMTIGIVVVPIRRTFARRRA